jgi:transcriptional regulator with GAF, ATPase, and Fis domain
LLRVLQEGTFERVGEDRVRRVDVRVIAATNRDLFDEVEGGRFRRDLYFRLNQIVVPAEFCKSRKPHVIPIAGPLVEIIERRKAVRAFEAGGTTQLCEYVFHRDGTPIAEFRRSWKTACTKTGCGNMIFHDLRRSAVRDLVRAGVPQSVAMSISGHSTVAVFQRYDIVAADDMKQALEKTAQFRAG